MWSYILIIIIGYNATSIEFNSQAECVEVRNQIIKEVNNDKLAAQCFKKIGGISKGS